MEETTQDPLFEIVKTYTFTKSQLQKQGWQKTNNTFAGHAVYSHEKSNNLLVAKRENFLSQILEYYTGLPKNHEFNAKKQQTTNTPQHNYF